MNKDDREEVYLEEINKGDIIQFSSKVWGKVISIDRQRKGVTVERFDCCCTTFIGIDSILAIKKPIKIKGDE